MLSTETQQLLMEDQKYESRKMHQFLVNTHTDILDVAKMEEQSLSSVPTRL